MRAPVLLAPALLALLLAGCAGVPRPVAPMCEEAVERDPEVRRLTAIGAGNQFFYAEHQDELRQARRRAELACLRVRGLAPRGGVETQRPLR